MAFACFDAAMTAELQKSLFSSLISPFIYLKENYSFRPNVNHL
uniref:Uncharacterized protein n=1 Tax=Vibrio parahaemolyticus TaxID=670 RepID=A0A1Y1BGW3_VIBPH|nr:hypothetical protein [Vibrio parahaemolyticus]